MKYELEEREKSNQEAKQQSKLLFISLYLHSDCQDFNPFFSLFIGGQSITQRSAGRGAPRYPPQNPGLRKGSIFRTRHLVSGSQREKFICITIKIFYFP